MTLPRQPFFNPASTTPFPTPDAEPTDPVPVRWDLFPVKATLATLSGSVECAKVRAFVTDVAVYLFQDAPRGPALVLYGLLADVIPPDTTTRALTLSFADPTPMTGATTLTLAPSGGCACGSRLKGFRPFPTTHYVPA